MVHSLYYYLEEGEIVLEVKNLSFSYSKNSPLILDDISFKISDGKITTILGPNGCGKSTLFYLMTKNLEPKIGEVTIGYRRIDSMTNREFAKKVAIVHQYNKVANDITVRQLVSYGRTPYQVMMKAKSEDDEKMIDWAMDVTDLGPVKDRTVNSLSGGQKQRVWIAMALAQGTKILFLDEPTTYLDIKYQLETLKLIRNLNRDLGITIIMVLHDINQAMYYSDEIIGLKNGKVLVKGDAKEVITEKVIEDLYGVHLKIIDLDGEKVIMNV